VRAEGWAFKVVPNAGNIHTSAGLFFEEGQFLDKRERIGRSGPALYLCPMQFVSYLLTVLLAEIFRFIPFPVLYRLSDGLTWGFYRTGYRRSVVYGNLRRCFPEKTAAEIDRLAHESYRNLADVTLESIKALTLPVAEIHRRMNYRGYEHVNRWLDQGRSVVLVGAHYNNWEWAALTVGREFHGRAVGIYKPLTNLSTDRWFNRKRSRAANITLVPMKDTGKALQQYKGQPSVFMLITDQSPSNRKAVHWVDFFGQPTACLPGADLIARQYDYPVVEYVIHRLRRGQYELVFSPVEDEPAARQKGEITRLFMEKLENTIRRAPENWLWSHRRWKLND
jgi:KDO2-lipid IV(A) lauroyltransferase